MRDPRPGIGRAGRYQAMGNREVSVMSRFLILGGSFAGLDAATDLVRRFGNKARVTVIDHSDRFIFRPSLPWILFGHRTPQQISVPFRPLFRSRGVEFVQDHVEAIDPKASIVRTARGEWAYDYLVIALGGTSLAAVPPDFARHGYSPLWLEGAVKLRQAIEQFRGGDIVIALHPRAPLICASYELIFQMHQHLRRRNLRQRSTISFVTYEDRPFVTAGPMGSNLVQQWLQRDKIRFFPSAFVDKVAENEVVLSDGRTLPASLFIFVPPYQGPRVVRDVHNFTDADGFVTTDRHMQALSYGNIYAAGDIVSFPGPKTGRMAELQARTAARNIAAAYGLATPQEYKSYLACLSDLGVGKGLVAIRKPAPQQGAVRDIFTFAGMLPHLAKIGFEKYFLHYRLRY